MRVGREGGGEREKKERRERGENWNELISLPLPSGTHVIKNMKSEV